jgi:ribosomal protein S18 acetylase RimI-like enzyme
LKRFSLVRGDAETEHDLFVRELTEHDPAMVSAAVQIDLETYSQPTLTAVSTGSMMRHGRMFLLEADGTVIGTCQCMRSWNNPAEVALVNQAIRSGWRGFGLGSWYLDQVLHILREHGFRSVVVHVGCDNRRARHLYEHKFDFVQVGGCELEYGPGEGIMMMRLVLEDWSPTRQPRS